MEDIPNLNDIITPWLIFLKSFDSIKRLVEREYIWNFVDLYFINCSISPDVTGILIIKQWYIDRTEGNG